MDTHRIVVLDNKPQISDVVDLLTKVITASGYDPRFASVTDLQDVAGRLSAIAGKYPPWGWRYLRNVLNHKLEPSWNLIDAAIRLQAAINGAPVDISKSYRIDVHAIGNVRPGSLILSDSKPCKGCGINFVPRVINQRFHSDACRKDYRRRWKV